MAYNHALAAQVRDALAEVPNVTEKKMFGSLGFLVGGHLTVGIGMDDIMVRLDKNVAADAVMEPGATTTVMRGREMKGWVDLAGEAIATDESLTRWVKRSATFVQTLKPK